MCGIFGLVISKESNYNQRFLSEALKNLALLSESRGKDPSGLCYYEKNSNALNVYNVLVVIVDWLEIMMSKQFRLSFSDIVVNKLIIDMPV